MPALRARPRVPRSAKGGGLVDVSRAMDDLAGDVGALKGAARRLRAEVLRREARAEASRVDVDPASRGPGLRGASS